MIIWHSLSGVFVIIPSFHFTKDKKTTIHNLSSFNYPREGSYGNELNSSLEQESLIRTVYVCWARLSLLKYVIN